MKRLAAALDTQGGVRLLWWLIGGSLVIGFFVFLAVGANGPDDPNLEGRQTVAGFDTVSITVEHGAVLDEFCALLAGTDISRQTGMMGRHDLGGYDAMVFAWPNPVDNTKVSFYNRKVPIALSIAWFADDGQFISTADMESCGDVTDCPRFSAASPFKFAVEVPKGNLGRLGIGPASALTLKHTGC